jgi:hypothetical protein
MPIAVPDISVAAPILARSPAEEELLARTVWALSTFEFPVALADGGSRSRSWSDCAVSIA